MSAPTPTRDDVPPGTYALVIHDGGQDLHQRESPSPWEDPEWIEKRQYDHGEVPPLNLQQTQVEQRTNGGSLQTVILYAEELTTTNTEREKSEKDHTGTQAAQEQQHRGYAIRFSDGQLIPGQDRTIHTTQEKNMGHAVEYLVTDHGLIGAIEIPHFPPRARQNCSINDNPEHPDGSEMRGAYELPDGYFLHTALNKRSKKNRIADLANQVGLSVEFLGDWE
jgi:hypothetical protein